MFLVRRGTLAVVGFGSAALLVSLAATPVDAEQSSASSPISVAKGAALKATLTALEKSVGGVVLAEAEEIERKLNQPLAAAPLPDLLNAVSKDFHFFWIRRPGTLVLQRRYLDGREIPDLEVEALKLAATDLYRLLKPFLTFDYGPHIPRRRMDFIRGLTAEQLRGMQGSGLPFARLQPAQQEMWKQFNSIRGFSTESLEYRRLAQMLSVWSRTEIAYVSRPTQLPGGAFEQQTLLIYQYPDPHPEAEKGFSAVPIREDIDPRELPYGPLRGVGRQLPARPHRLGPAFQKRVPLPPGETTPATLVGAIAKHTGQRIRIPAYARNRRLLAYGTPSAVELISALEDLYGWIFQLDSKGRHLLDRPNVPPATDLRDLYHKAQAVVPPAAFHLFQSADLTSNNSFRYDTQLLMVYEAITRLKGKGWKQVWMKELDEKAQQRMAINLFFGKLFATRLVERAEPPLWLAAPEQGYLTLSGPLGPGEHPRLMFHVRRPDGRLDSWGWIVGSSSTSQ